MSASSADERPVTVALVNNMPDAAFTETEDQFRRVTQAAGAGGVELALYTFTEVPRSREIGAMVQKRYHDADELWARTPDALIVTGTEPTTAHMTLEPTWPALARLLEWATSAVPAVLLSCLASHASLQLFDGLERRPRARKCSGVFRGHVGHADDPLAVGLPHEVAIPHSRCNEVEEDALVRAGYRITVGGSGDAGWSVATRSQGESQFVLCQGHPEYGTLNLLREYRRDVGRFLSGRTQIYPSIPEGYLGAEAADILRRFAERATMSSGADRHDLWAGFPYGEVAAAVTNPWAVPSQTLFANWICLARAGARVVA